MRKIFHSGSKHSKVSHSLHVSKMLICVLIIMNFKKKLLFWGMSNVLDIWIRQYVIMRHFISIFFKQNNSNNRSSFSLWAHSQYSLINLTLLAFLTISLMNFISWVGLEPNQKVVGCTSNICATVIPMGRSHSSQVSSLGELNDKVSYAVVCLSPSSTVNASQ